MAGSGIIPRAFIDDLITRIDIVDLIDSYVPLKRAGRSFVACCPFHQEKSPSFNVSQTKQFYHCFGCGVSGNSISFMMSYRNLEFREAIEELAARAGLEVPYENNKGFKEQAKNSLDLYTVLSHVTDYYQKLLYESPQAELAREYVRKRELSGTVVKEYQLGYALDGWNNLIQTFPKAEKELIATGMLVEKAQGRPYDQYRNRLMFPIHDRRGRIIGFGGRVLDSTLPKYINSPETTLFHKSKTLYGLYQISQKNPHPEYILVVEGYMDVIALAQNGISNAVAALGTATTRDHIQSLLRYSKHLVFCFDGDKAGRKAAWKALESTLPYLDAQAQFHFMFLPENEDPDTLIRQEGKEAFERRIKQATSMDVFFFEELMRSLDLSSMADRGKLVEMAKPYFATIPSCAYQDLMMEQLARFARMNMDLLQKQIHGKSERYLSNATEYPKNYRVTPKNTVKSMTRTNARIALALLIQHPELIEQIKVMPSADNSKGGKMLQDIMYVLKKESIRSTGGLLEYYREHEYYPWITRLAIFSHGAPLNGISEEFLGAIQNMQKEQKDKEIRSMLQQKSSATFSDSDRRELFEKIRKNKTER
jgi:DNA primase